MDSDQALVENQDERRHIQIARREFHGEGKRTWRRRKTSRFREADAWEASIRDGAFVIILRNG
ncbi:MAG: hypothetical protein KKB90_01085, partial [Actinobacteria bacterium]|nr:hypothetical protein [Actinomycetota bacterium]MBU4360111.1 hypothetical protein [Actinomycetota bacterium]MBU4440872.1 hypothetical protein [Actinomycetota bacterium]